MARPKKAGLDYFPFDVDFFSDRKIKRLRASYGADGTDVYLYLLCEIYRSGYYVRYDDDLILDISDELNITVNSIKQILSYLFSRSLLVVKESKLAVPVKIITAASVQRRYQAAKKGAKRDIDVAAEFWVLEKEETESFIKVRPENGFSGNNESFSGKYENKSRNNDTKESKVKESKEKESKGASPTLSDLESEYGKDIVDKYASRVRNWYASTSLVLSDLPGTVKKWLEQDGVEKNSLAKYESLINKF